MKKLIVCILLAGVGLAGCASDNFEPLQLESTKDMAAKASGEAVPETAPAAV